MDLYRIWGLNLEQRLITVQSIAYKSNFFQNVVAHIYVRDKKTNWLYVKNWGRGFCEYEELFIQCGSFGVGRALLRFPKLRPPLDVIYHFNQHSLE